MTISLITDMISIYKKTISKVPIQYRYRYRRYINDIFDISTHLYYTQTLWQCLQLEFQNWQRYTTL